ncbi:H-NS family nucleoid-associated regulatory protein [Paraburkholderia phytofirmans]|uniref:H-NS family nucleoid-associated regulatory protein n=1 Tax=Paraburkholderia phytofirmans TaxID=261302 RepID=UPI0009EDA184|nr:H-NS family nucleoid-associated regulatory protein [Paraburkholderia phytofirmans]
MANYLELKAQAEALAAQAEEARLEELQVVLDEVRARVTEYGLTVEQVFGAGASSNVVEEAAVAEHHSPDPAPAVKTSLNPAAAWPFPSGSRP